MTERERAPWWLWPNLLSLDAPLVAVAWLWMYCQLWGVRSLPGSMWITLAFSVWAVYALDRLIDSCRTCPRASLQRRHHIHLKFRWYFIFAITAAVSWSIYASLKLLSQLALQYGLFVASLVVSYFLVAWVKGQRESTGITKNLIAGMTFSYGSACGAHAYLPSEPFTSMLFSREVLLFGLLCAINMTAIDFWELRGEDAEDASALVATATLLVAGFSVFHALDDDYLWAKPFHYALIVGSGGIYFLNRLRHELDCEARRLWVDLALLAPVLVFWVWTTWQRAA